MTRRVVFDGRANVSHNQILVESGGRSADFSAAFSGQEHGLVGSGEPGCVILLTGTHTGEVGLRVVLHDDGPPVGPRWEDVVEAAFVPAGPEVTLFGLMSDVVCVFPLPASSYRVRWSGTGMDEAYDGTVGADEPLVDTFELAIWPAAPRPAEIVRQASRRGREAHLASTPEGREEIARRFERPEWSDGPGGEVQRRAARSMVDLDRAFAERLGAATTAQLVAVRNRVVRFVCVELGTARLPWVASALDALDADRPLSTSFNPGTVYRRLDDELSDLRDGGPDHPGWAQGGWSLFMVISAAHVHTDALDGALAAIVNGFTAFGRERDSDVVDQALSALDT